MPARFDAEFYQGKSWGANGIAEAWDLPSLKLRTLMKVLGARTQPDATLLEVGCGSGRILRSVRDRDARLRLTGIDLSAEGIASARRSHAALAIDYVEGSGDRLPFADGAFDYVAFLDYLEHVERPQASLDEVARVLRPGGTLHFVCPAEGEFLTPYRLSQAIFKRHFKESTLGHIQQFTFAQIEAMVRQAGLSIVDRSYSYHLAGSLMDYTLFTLLLDPRIAAVYWKHDKYHESEATPKRSSLAGRALNAVMTLGNAIAYLESSLLQKVRPFASAIHVTAVKPYERRPPEL